MRLSTLCILIVLLVAAAPAAAQESFSATHMARLDILEPDPGAGTIGGVAIITYNPGSGLTQLRISAAPQGDAPDSLFIYHNAAAVPVVLARMAFPENSPTITLAAPILTEPMLQAVDSGYIWLAVSRRSNRALFANGPVQSIASAVAPEPSGEEVVPPVNGLEGIAHLSLTYDPGMNSFRYNAWWLYLTGPPTAVRIRRGEVGANGDLVFEIPFTSGSEQAIGTWMNPTEEIREAMLQGQLYFEITTAAYPNGELRGQIYALEGFTAALEPENEVPPVTGSTASGTAYLLITAHGTPEVFNKLQGVIGNLSGPITAAHIHRGAIGQSGDPIVTLERPTPVTIDLELASGSAGGAMSDEVVGEIRAINTYVNVHTAANQNGEARGQLIPARSRLQMTSAVRTTSAATAGFTARYDRSIQRITCTIEPAPGARIVAMYAPDGRLVRSAMYDGSRCEISTAGLPAGPYFLRLQKSGAVCPVMVMP